jgi:hypothetical protein
VQRREERVWREAWMDKGMMKGDSDWEGWGWRLGEGGESTNLG